MRLEGAVALITGASEGIGAATADLLRQRGARLSLVARSESRLISLSGPKDLVNPGDLLKPADRKRVIERTMEKYGRIDLLINNAGAGLYAPSHQTSMEDARKLFELNFFAPLELSQLAAEHMKNQRGGTIVNVSSIAGKMTLPWFTLYSASKYAVVSLSEGLRMELRSYGVHCMAVCPGYVRTRFQMNVLHGAPPALTAWQRHWAITPQQCARDIVKGIERGARTVVTPRSGWLLVAAQRLFPGVLERRLESIYLQNRGRT
jgi:short-subunit dehydrogenase